MSVKNVNDVESHHEIARTCSQNLAKQCSLNRFHEITSAIDYFTTECEVLGDCLAQMKCEEDDQAADILEQMEGATSHDTKDRGNCTGDMIQVVKIPEGYSKQSTQYEDFYQYVVSHFLYLDIFSVTSRYIDKIV